LQGEQFGEAAQALRDGNLDAARITPEERRLLEFITTLTRHAYKITDEQVQGLRDVGWSDPQIAEAVYIGSLFNLFVRVADAFDIHPAQERELDGEVPRAVREGPSA
jgi:alkylhydroperoxidase family enzyme